MHLTITSGYVEYDVTTNAKGYYSVKVMPYYNSTQKTWNAFAITTNAKGYQNKTAVVYPKKNSTIKKPSN